MKNATLLALCAAWALPAPGLACAVPVFRYALERWEPDAYHLRVYHRGPLGAEFAETLSALAGPASPVNLRVEYQADDLPADLLPLVARGPVLSVQAPGGGADPSPLWVGPLSDGVVRKLVRSPARAVIAERILAGHTAVFLYLGDGDPAGDASGYARVVEALAEAERTLDLDAFARAAGRDVDALVPAGAPPLRVAFSALAVARRDPAELFLVSPILRMLPGPPPPGVPVLVPVFGRGRALPPLVGEAITPGAIAEACRFLVDACSCEVKALNPGTDLLVASDWGGDWPRIDLAEHVLPPLEGIATPPPPPAAVAAPVPMPPPGTGLPRRALAVSLGIVVLGILAATGWLVRRGPPGRRPPPS